jgi:hypothetical protein
METCSLLETDQGSPGGHSIRHSTSADCPLYTLLKSKLQSQLGIKKCLWKLQSREAVKETTKHTSWGFVTKEVQVNFFSVKPKPNCLLEVGKRNLWNRKRGTTWRGVSYPTDKNFNYLFYTYRVFARQKTRWLEVGILLSLNKPVNKGGTQYSIL